MTGIAVSRKHYHDGGELESGERAFSPSDQTISRCSCGKFVRYTFRGNESWGGWYWIALNPWLRWKWRKELAAAALEKDTPQ